MRFQGDDMRTMRICRGVFLLLFTAATAGYGAEVIGRHYTEDFSTKQLCDTLETTAFWDTLSGELKLPPFEVTLAGSYNTSGTSYGIAVAGDYAFIADYGSGVMVVDISDPTTPFLVGIYNTSGSSFGIAVSGNYLYVADQSGGLVVLNITNPVTPALVSTYNTTGTAYGVFIEGDYAYVADGLDGLAIIDISNPAALSLIGSYNTSGKAYGVEVAGDHAYIADGESGLQVIDISDPASPSAVGYYDTPGYAWDVDIEGDMLYLVDDTEGFYAIEIKNPAKPKYIGHMATPSAALGLEVNGDLAYIACYYSGLLVVDVTDPASPVTRLSWNTPGSSYEVTVAGEYAFIADAGAGLQVLDVRNIAPSEEYLIVNFPDFNGWDIDVRGDIAYIANWTYGLASYDISDPVNTTFFPLLGTCSFAGIGKTVDIEGDVAFVGDYTGFLRSIDITDPSAPVLISSCALPDTVWDVCTSGDYAYIGCMDFGLQVVDISDPSSMTIVGNYATGLKAGIVEDEGNLLFVGTTEDIRILDISAPASPSLLHNLNVGGEPTHFAVSGDYLYVLVYPSDFMIIDISNPLFPVIESIMSTIYKAFGIVVDGDYAYITKQDCSSCLQIIDISDPSAPTFVKGSMKGHGREIELHGNFVVTCDDMDIEITPVFQNFILNEENAARSLEIDQSDNNIAAIKFSPVVDNPSAFQFEVTSYVISSWATWVSVSAFDEYRFLASYNMHPNLGWRAEIDYEIDYLYNNPTCTSISIDWLYECADIDSIVDVPGDQGGWARVHFACSAFDLPNSSTPVSGYNIYRRIDDPLLVSRLTGVEASGAKETPGLDSVNLDGREFITADVAAAAGFPPGTWETVSYVIALQQEEYICLVPTLDDSSAVFRSSVYCILAQISPAEWYVSSPDSGFSIDNIAPGVPLGLEIAYNTGSGNTLVWDDSPEEDFQYYRIYRGDSEDFIPDPGNLIHETAVSEWADPDYDGWDIHYKVTALDHAGNESDPTGAGITTGDDTPAIPQTFALHQNIPNPFNPTTKIRFDLPSSSRVTLVVYNVRGERVATLIDSHMAAGSREITWNGTADSGSRVASGIYFYRLTAPGFAETRKMVLLR